MNKCAFCVDGFVQKSPYHGEPIPCWRCKPPKQKVQCKLCACEGVDSTVLCRDHLDGYKYAVKLLLTDKYPRTVVVADWLAEAIQQQKGANKMQLLTEGEDNGQDGT